MSIQNSKPEILTLKDWLITFLIMAIPIVNIIMLLLWAFENKVNENKSNWAKATLIWIGIFMIFGLIIGLIAGEMLGSFASVQAKRGGGVAGIYKGTNNFGGTSTLIVRSDGFYTSWTDDDEPGISGNWKEESGNKIAFYADNGYGGMDKSFTARITESGLQVIGGNLYSRQ